MPQTHAAERTHRLVSSPAGRIHLVEEGTGPLVLLVHGFPESWYSWRHQLPVLAAAATGWPPSMSAATGAPPGPRR